MKNNCKGRTAQDYVEESLEILKESGIRNMAASPAERISDYGHICMSEYDRLTI